ncbi:MAG TPA: TolC family protein [bacterium]|nr:TolC family protein [bacterium]HPJ72298.1 TolC family protein [bacterium]HPQ65511.1 TolC family protein [bacterium]
MKSARIGAIVGLISLGMTPLSAQTGDRDFLTGLTEEALAANPLVRSYYLQSQAALAEAGAAGSLPQPQIGFAYFGEAVQTKVGPQESKYSISQTIPFPTKLSLNSKIADRAAQVEQIKYVLAVRDTVQQIKLTFFDYYLTVSTLATLREEKAILNQMLGVARSRYETSPNLNQTDLIKINLEAAALEAAIIGAESRENMGRASLNRILARPPETALDIPEGYAPLTSAPTLTESQAREEALRESPLVLLDRLGVEKERFRLSLAREEYLPDFGVMGEYIQIGDGTTSLPDDGQDAWLVGVNVRVPLWFWSIRSRVDAQQYRLNAVEAALADRENFIVFKINDLYFGIRSLTRLIDLYENVLYPQARQNFSVSQSAYEQGNGDFLNWLDSERKLLSIRLELTAKIVDYNKTVARLEYILGRPVP